jgi:hypothetical protein
MVLKAGVTADNVQPQIWFACGVADEVYRIHGRLLVVTSLTDSHADRPTSLHNRGLAVDLRIRDLDNTVKRSIMLDLNRSLHPRGYDVVLEKDHIHIEYDPKPGDGVDLDTAWLK